MKRILCMGDLHCGNLLGLTPPEWQQERVPTAKPLWDWYVKTTEEIGPVDVQVLNGDLVDGEGKKETIGLITTDVDEQAEIAIRCIEVVAAEKRMLTFGTPFHTAGVSSYERRVADGLNAPIFETLMLEAEGVRFNIRHTGGRSDIPYGQGTQLYKEVVRDMLHACIEEYKAADVVVRSHVHYYLHMESAQKHAVSLPCFLVPDSVYARTLRTMYYDLGLVLVEVDDGIVRVKPYIMPLKIVRKREYVRV